MTDLELSEHLATKFHAGQMYGEWPYTTHIAHVRGSVGSHFPGDERLKIIANLHDILEDTSMTEPVLRALFDDDIVDAVVALTKLENESRSDYLFRVKSNPLALKVKLCDSLSNLHHSMKRNDMRRVRKYAEYIAYLSAP